MRRWILVLLLLALSCLCFAQIDTSKWHVVNNLADGDGFCHFTANQSVSGGFLTLSYSTGSYTCNPSSTASSHAEGMIISQGASPFSFTYGVAKARIKFGTSGQTLWSAFWMWGGASGSFGYPATCLANIESAEAGTLAQPVMAACTNGSSQTSYEIDIAESQQSATSINANYITWVNGVATSNAGSCTVSPDNGAAFHIYELDWYPSTLVFKVDGAICRTIAASVSVPMFLILDQERAATSTAPTTTVDWVRVCGDPNAPCNPGDPTMIFDDEFNEGVVTTPVNHAVQGQTVQGGAIQ